MYIYKPKPQSLNQEGEGQPLWTPDRAILGNDGMARQTGGGILGADGKAFKVDTDSKVDGKAFGAKLDTDGEALAAKIYADGTAFEAKRDTDSNAFEGTADGNAFEANLGMDGKADGKALKVKLDTLFRLEVKLDGGGEVVRCVGGEAGQPIPVNLSPAFRRLLF